MKKYAFIAVIAALSFSTNIGAQEMKTAPIDTISTQGELNPYGKIFRRVKPLRQNLHLPNIFNHAKQQ